MYISPYLCSNSVYFHRKLSILFQCRPVGRFCAALIFDKDFGNRHRFHANSVISMPKKEKTAANFSSAIHGRKAHGAAIAPARTPQAQTASRLRHLPTLRSSPENSAWFVHHKIRKRRVRPARRHISRLYREKTLPWCLLCAANFSSAVHGRKSSRHCRRSRPNASGAGIEPAASSSHFEARHGKQRMAIYLS